MHEDEVREAAYAEIVRRMNQIARQEPANTLRFQFGVVAGQVWQEWAVPKSREIEEWYARWQAERLGGA